MFIICGRVLKWLLLSLLVTTLVLAQTIAAPPPIKLALIETLSGPFANTGEAVFRNLLWAVERVNARGG
ncbi:MAG: branched-chain amino acid ABC transporter substrate-binding protein, partial [Burkholderiales bacterium]|nr:branched-chain amino acid ABC transporter substrate-binding protein [Burkholderiales bacterium]